MKFSDTYTAHTTKADSSKWIGAKNTFCCILYYFSRPFFIFERLCTKKLILVTTSTLVCLVLWRCSFYFHLFSLPFNQRFIVINVLWLVLSFKNCQLTICGIGMIQSKLFQNENTIIKTTKLPKLSQRCQCNRMKFIVFNVSLFMHIVLLFCIQQRQCKPNIAQFKCIMNYVTIRNRFDLIWSKAIEVRTKAIFFCINLLTFNIEIQFRVMNF